MQKYYRRMAFVPMLVVVWTKEKIMDMMKESLVDLGYALGVYVVCIGAYWIFIG